MIKKNTLMNILETVLKYAILAPLILFLTSCGGGGGGSGSNPLATADPNDDPLTLGDNPALVSPIADSELSDTSCAASFPSDNNNDVLILPVAII